jgi:predicted phosphohydrolase
MQMTFDLISDLHLGPTDTFDWTGIATSPFCVVAGDISMDVEIVRDTLEHLGQCYQAVFYIDGNNEHRYSLDSLSDSYNILEEAVAGLENVVFLQDNCVIVNNVAFVGTNGWWTYDLDSSIDDEQCRLWYCDVMDVGMPVTSAIHSMAYNDVAYLRNSIKKLQTHKDITSIVVVTHTVPKIELIEHDIELDYTHKFNTMGNSVMEVVLDQDTEHKVKTWCFGHYHNSVDQSIAGVRYVNNCRGRPDGPSGWSQPYYPRRIVIDV